MLDSQEQRFMNRALALARRGIGKASPNPTVGCVIARDNAIVGQGWHRYSLIEHAEVRALRAAAMQARGATVYVTLEPCSHQGRTPPCTGALIEAGVRRVVVAMVDPNPQVSGKGIRLLRSAGIEVELGLGQKEAARLIEPFACYVTTGSPLIVGKVAMSLDGRIATAGGKARWITSPEGRTFTQYLRRQMDAVLVGIGTVRADDPELTYRGKPTRERGLTRVILDSELRTSPGARVFESATDSPVVIFCARGASSAHRKCLEVKGADVIPVPKRSYGLDLAHVISELGSRRILGVLVEGGSEVHWSFLSQQLVDKFYFIVAPLILAGRRSIPAIGGQGFETIEGAPRFKITRDFKVGPDLVREAYPPYSRSNVSPWLS